MSGGLFINALLRETESRVTPEQVALIQSLHAQAYQELARKCARCLARGSCWPTLTSGRGAVGDRHERPVGCRRTGAGALGVQKGCPS